jgi:AraC family transcriptional regulator
VGPEDEGQVQGWDVPLEQIVGSSGGRGWRGLDAAEIVHPVDDFAVPALPRHVLVFNLGTPMAATERHTGHAGHLGDEGVMILPAGMPRDWHLDRCGEVRHLHLYLDPWLVSAVATEAELNPDRVEIREAFGASDQRLALLGVSLLAELRTGDPLGRIYADGLATALAAHLLRHHSSLTRAVLRGPNTLPPATLKRATEYIEAHLADDLSLAALAGAANYSPYHFARLFKASTGTAPHGYIIRRRVERARLLLASTNWPLAHIAQEVGFASGSHLARHFRRLLGVAPSNYR